MTGPGSLFFLLIAAAAVSQASVSASLDKTAVKRGESVTLTLRVEGKSVVPPQISTLCGTGVERREDRELIGNVEGGFQKAQLYRFHFRPESECVIEPIAIEVDGVESYSQPLNIVVDGAGPEVQQEVLLELRSSKRELYVGEPFEVELIVKKGVGAEKKPSSLTAPEMQQIWVKHRFDTPPVKEGNYTVSSTRYHLAAQQAGSLQISPAEIKVATDYQMEDGWGNPREERVWESFYSNALELDVMPLPDEVALVGDFSIALEIDKREAEPNMPLGAEIVIHAAGNIEDIASLKPEISGVDVFAGEPAVERDDEGVREIWRQPLTFVAANSFTIPAVVLVYFDPEDKHLKRVQTEPVQICVPAKPEPTVETEREGTPESEGVSRGWGVALYLSGFITALLLFMIPWKRWFSREMTPEKQAPEDDRRALILLLRHREEEGVEKMILKLEARLYAGEETEIDRKALKRLLKRFG